MIEAASPHAYHPFMAWIDLHIDTLWAMRRLGADPVAEASGLHVDLPRLQAVDLRLAIWAIWVEADLHGPDATALALRMLGAGQALPGQSDGRLQAILGPDDLERCLAGEASGMLLGLEGAHPLQGNLEMLRGFHALGLRVLTLTWNNSNAFASGCATEPHEDH
ncbi:MAG: membrane dipeptidase, partial [Candidatus Eisenbacteria sp.]|nr:membrane dipeptidase [Candidatus Eisenbacteria bacterium]